MESESEVNFDCFSVNSYSAPSSNLSSLNNLENEHVHRRVVHFLEDLRFEEVTQGIMDR